MCGQHSTSIYDDLYNIIMAKYVYSNCVIIFMSSPYINIVGCVVVDEQKQYSPSLAYGKYLSRSLQVADHYDQVNVYTSLKQW